MAKNEKTGARVGHIASQTLRNPGSSTQQTDQEPRGLCAHAASRPQASIETVKEKVSRSSFVIAGVGIVINPEA
jgi:hypothetical protein